MTWRVASILVGVFLSGTPALAQLQPAEPAAIIAAVETCENAITATGVDLERLRADGWGVAQASTDGKPAALPFSIYGKGKVMLMLPTDRDRSCFVLARVKDVATTKAIANQFEGRFGKSAGLMQGSPFWLTAGKAVQFATTGSRNEPGVRIAVVATSGEKK